MAIGLALTFMATGCKKTPIILTNLKNRPSPVGDGGPGTGGTFTPGPGGSGPGGGPTADWPEGDYNPNRIIFNQHIVHFDFDSHVVKSSEKGHVQAVANELSSNAAAKLVIEGHCDERGTDEYNRALGERRALALREELAGLGVDPMRIKTKSFGKDQPVDPGQNEAAYAKNRRGEFILMTPK